MRHDDRALLDAWGKGDRSAGNNFVARHFDAIYNFFAFKIAEDVSDLVQRTFLGCLEGLPRFRGDCAPRTFLFSIARYELYGHFRKKKRDASYNVLTSSLRDLGPSPTSVLGRRDTAAALVSALESIPLELQVLLELRFWEGMTGPELAVVLDIPVGTVASRTRRALTLLRERLQTGNLSEKLP
ncbi:MAG: sigma-70 family RNA polymerase sigma factor, partial [Myxococcota bacterium]